MKFPSSSPHRETQSSSVTQINHIFAQFSPIHLNIDKFFYRINSALPSQNHPLLVTSQQPLRRHGILTQVEVVHAVRHQHVVQHRQIGIVVAREELERAVRPRHVLLCKWGRGYGSHTR